MRCARVELPALADDDWKNRPRNLDPTINHPTLYLRSLHWCMGVMSGYSDGTVPVTAEQYIFTLIVLNIGLFTFAYTVWARGPTQGPSLI